MRRTLAVLLAALVLVAALTCVAFGVIGATKDQVTYQENILYGDASIAEGLTVSARYGYDNHVYWFTDHQPALGGETDTTFRFYTNEQQFDYAETYDGAYMEVVDTWDIYWDYIVETEGVDTSRFFGLLEAYYELYQDTELGELTNTYLRYADYCDYYPLNGWMDFPENTDGYWQYYDDCYRYGEDAAAAKAFNDYFRIPVLEDDWVQVVIDRRTGNGAAESVDVSNSRKGTDYFQMECVGVTSSTTMYFTFRPYTAQGNLVDTSLIPGGYGLYAIDYAKNEYGRNAADYTTLRTLCALDPAYVPLQMWVDEEQNVLVLETEENEAWYLTVIDLETNEIIQHLELLQPPEDQYCWARFEDDFIVVMVLDVSVSVFEQNEDGLYEFRFTASVPEFDDPLRHDTYWYDENGNEIYSIDTYNLYFDFDGERLAVVSGIDQDYGYYAVDACAYALSIYTENGLQFCAEYMSSLQPLGQTDYNRQCRKEELDVVWTQ